MNKILCIAEGSFDITSAAKTAMHRKSPSAPLKLLLERHEIIGRVLDYGCGHGADVDHLVSLGYEVVGWDPVWSADKPQGKFDTILCTYVLNVVPKYEASKIAKETRSYLKDDGSVGKIFYTVRADTVDTATQRLVTSVPKSTIYTKGSGFFVWCYKK